jgi:outer membrane receptor protein involved in Fe transport
MKYGFAGAIALAGGAALAASAHAQQANAQPTGLSEVIVTAERREEKAQHVGVALSVLNGKQLLDRGVSNVNDLQHQTPSLEITPAFGGGQPNFRLRGVGFDDYASNNTSPVGVYIDDVALPFPIETQGLLFDVSRVEVLRGPQGTLWGRNTTGGAINFLTNGPTDSFHAGLDATYGRYAKGPGRSGSGGATSSTSAMTSPATSSRPTTMAIRSPSERPARLQLMACGSP